MLTWEEARRSIYPLPRDVTTQPVDLDWLRTPAPCVACGDQAEVAYRGTPFHALCAIELAFYVELVRRGERPALQLPSGLVLETGSADALELPVGR